MGNSLRGRRVGIITVGDGTYSFGDFTAKPGALGGDLAGVDGFGLKEYLQSLPGAGSGYALEFGKGLYRWPALSLPFGALTIIANRDAAFYFDAATPVAGTDCLGIHVPPNTSDFTMEGVTLYGHVGTPSVNGHYSLISAACHGVRIKGVRSRHGLSTTTDNLLSGTPTLLKPLSLRNFRSCTDWRVGQSKIEQPNVDNCYTPVDVEIIDSSFFGEPVDPLGAGSPATGEPAWVGSVVGVHLRQCNTIRIQRSILGSFTSQDPANAVELWFKDATPTAGTTFRFFDGVHDDPVDIKFVASISGATPYKRQIAIVGGWNKLQVAAEMLEELEAARVAGVLTINQPTAPWPGAQHIVGVACSQFATNPVMVEVFNDGGGNAGSCAAVKITKTTSWRQHRWLYGAINEDSLTGVHDFQIGDEIFDRCAVEERTTGAHNQFTKKKASEGGHSNTALVGHSITYGQNLFRSSSGGFNVYNGGNVGQVGAGAAGTYTPVIETTYGTHTRRTLTITSDLPVDGNEFAIDDNDASGHPLNTFQWKAGADPAEGGKIRVQIGADALTCARAARDAVTAAFVAGNLNAFAEAKAGASNSAMLDVTFIGEGPLPPSVPTVTETGANTSWADTSRPYMACTSTVALANVHWSSDADGYAQPVVLMRGVYGLALVTGLSLQHCRPIRPSLGGKAIAWLVWAEWDSNPSPGSLMPADNTKVVVNNNAKSYTFRLKVGGGEDTGTLKYIDTTGMTTIGQRTEALVAKINEFGGAGDLQVFATRVHGILTTSPPLVGGWAIMVQSKIAGTNANLISVSDSPFTEWYSINPPGVYPAATDGSTGSDEQRKLQFPIVFDNCTFPTVQNCAAVPFMNTDWQTTGVPLNLFNNVLDLDASLLGPDQGFVYVKCDEGRLCYPAVQGLVLHGPWGKLQTGAAKAVELGTYVDPAKVVLKNIIVNGVSVA